MPSFSSMSNFDNMRLHTACSSSVAGLETAVGFLIENRGIGLISVCIIRSKAAAAPDVGSASLVYKKQTKLQQNRLTNKFAEVFVWKLR